MYASHIWKEHTGSETDKIGSLNNLETQHDEAKAYLDAYFHDSRYYLKAEADAKYFTSSNDGSGSGLVARTIDGYTAQQIIDLGTPSGGVVAWSRSEDSIPAGWYLCNGSNGTPNLRNRFIIVAGGAYTRGTFGGYESVQLSASSVTIGTHALTASELPPHTHSYTDQYRANVTTLVGSGPMNCAAASDHASTTDDIGASDAHGHPGSTFTGDTIDLRPPFMALCFIQKS